MARSEANNKLTPIAKYTIFKRAYDEVNRCMASDNLITAYVLAFSILEDRSCAALVTCCEVLDKKFNPQNASKTAFKNRVQKLYQLGAIDAEIHDELYAAIDHRNELTHEMMWNVDVFKKDDVIEIRRLINALQKVQRKYQKQIKSMINS